MTTVGHRLLVTSGLLIAMLGAVASSLVIWFFAWLDFSGNPLERESYLHMATGFGLAAALVLAGLVPVRALGGPSWLRTAGVVLAVMCTVAAGLALVGARSAPPETFLGEPWWWPLQLFALCPTTWPLVLLVAVSPWVGDRAVRGQWSPTPR